MSFEPPKTDVTTAAEVTITPKVNAHLGAYLMEDVTLEFLKGSVVVGYGDVELDLTEENYGLAAGMDDFVDVVVTLYVKDPETGAYTPVSEISDVKEDVQYKLAVAVTPKYSDSNGDRVTATAEDEGVIYVFKPELTFRDSSDFYYGEELPDYGIEGSESDQALEGCWVHTAWKHTENDSEDLVVGSDDVDMSTDAPELGIEITGPAGMDVLPNEDVPMSVNVTRIGYLVGDSLNGYVKFHWVPCEPACDQIVSSHEGDAENTPEFYLHPQTCQLSIEKTVTGGLDEGQAFLFRVKGTAGTANADVDVTVAFNADDFAFTPMASVTLKQLPAGDYTVTELVDWSWRYEPSPGTSAIATATLGNGADKAKTVSFSNKRSYPYWLSGDSWRENWWGGTGGGAIVTKPGQDSEGA